MNHAQGVRQLVDVGANLQIRSSDLHGVSLHEVVHGSAPEAVKRLLAPHAPSRHWVIPLADLARKTNNTGCAEVLVAGTAASGVSSDNSGHHHHHQQQHKSGSRKAAVASCQPQQQP